MQKTIEDYMKMNFPGLQDSLKILSQNPELLSHSKKVAYYALCIFDELKERFHLNESERRILFCSALLHDVGKTLLNGDILYKKTRLTEEELELIRSHPEEGIRFLNRYACGEEIERHVLHHHERYDGKGYPKGLHREDIPLLSRIIAIADSFDAMISTRCYKKNISRDCALGEILENAGSQFDPVIAGLFIHLVETNKVQCGWEFQIQLNA